jgi:hypothetical protein
MDHFPMRIAVSELAGAWQWNSGAMRMLGVMGGMYAEVDLGLLARS